MFLLSLEATWECVEHWIEVQKLASVDLMDFGPSDRDKKHVHNSEPSITLVRSDGCDFISHSANRGVRRGCLWML